MISDNVLAALRFVEEIDRLKGVQRQSLVYDGSRRENTAEHSWHLATSVLVMAGLANEPVDLERALKMALIHDIVEIDAGDTFVYDVQGDGDKAEREERAARRLFGLIAGHGGEELHALWKEFEAQRCPESRFVAAVDRLLPTISNFRTRGHSWNKHGIVKSQVMEKMLSIRAGSEKLGAWAESMVEESVRQGFLPDR